MNPTTPFPASSLVDRVYHRVKTDLFDFQLIPGDRFTETEVALRVHASRTPVREALMRLEREGYLTMKPKAGWQVKPFDFRLFQELYDLRVILETSAIRKVVMGLPRTELDELAAVWIISPLDRTKDGRRLAEADEAFHHTLVVAAGNGEVSRLHQEITERIRIIRRLDFTDQDRVSATYDEHELILKAIRSGQGDLACELLEEHIAQSRAAVETITMARLELARSLRYETS
jgi:DNA-binding GntR family transcriptional regulator